MVDPSAVEPGLALRGLALGLASGLIGGLALGCGTVLFFAIVSDRIRRRSDVAEALGVPVTISVGRLTPLRPGLQRLPFLRSVERRRATDRERLAYAITAQLNVSGRRSIGIACVDNAAEVGYAVATAAAELSARGEATVVIDLSDERCGRPSCGRPAVDGGGASLGDGAGPATILRPKGVPALAASLADLTVVGGSHREGIASSPETADVTLVLAELDPSVGADHLKTWTDRALVVVTAGRSNAERLRTVGRPAPRGPGRVQGRCPGSRRGRRRLLRGRERDPDPRCNRTGGAGQGFGPSEVGGPMSASRRGGSATSCPVCPARPG